MSDRPEDIIHTLTLSKVTLVCIIPNNVETDLLCAARVELMWIIPERTKVGFIPQLRHYPLTQRMAGFPHFGP
jgi:hypothetical protein